MGTRGLLGWINSAGNVTASYNHFDSYPDGLGSALQLQLTEAPDNWYPSEGIRWVEQDGTPEPSDLEWAKKHGIVPADVSTGKDWYALMRETQGRMDKWVELKLALDGSGFEQDSLFCEWGYLLDERSHEVVVIRGFNTTGSAEAPYCVTDRTDPSFTARLKRNGYAYYGCSEAWRGSPAEFLALDMESFYERISSEERGAEEESEREA